MLNIFSCAFGPLYVFLGELFRSAHFLIGLVVVFDTELHELMYILEDNSLSVALFANIFSHSEGCLHFAYDFLCSREDFKFN